MDGSRECRAARRRIADGAREKNLFYNMQLNVDTRHNVGVEGTQLLVGNSVMIGLLEPAEDCVDNVVEYSRRGSIANASVGSGSGGGGVDDILKRLGNVETGVSELRSEFRATIPHLATAASVAQILAIIPHLATKAELADLKAAVISMETTIIKWIIATVLTTATAAFSIARIVH